MSSVGKTRAIWVIVGGALVGGGLAVPAQAEAEPGAAAAKKGKRSPAIKMRTATGTTTGHEQLLSLTATCPKRTTLVGGGFSSGVLAPAASLDIHLIYESRRFSPSQWIVSGGRVDSDSSGNQLDLVSYAQCRAAKEAKKMPGKRSRDGAAISKKKRGKKFKVTEFAASLPLLSGFLNSATTSASCPGRSKAISGGFSISPAPFTGTTVIDFVFPWESRRTPGKGWTTSAANLSPQSRSLTTFAYCAPGKAPKERSSSVFLSGSVLSTAAADSPPCPSRLRLASGGFVTAAPSQDDSSAIFITSAPSGATWHSVAVQNAMADSGANITTSGYCL